MVYDPGVLKASLAAAVGDDPVLVGELRAAYAEGAQRHFDALRTARRDAEWASAAWRLKSLAGSFEAAELMDLADRALTRRPGDRDILALIGRALPRV